MPSYLTRLILVLSCALAADCGQQQDTGEVTADDAGAAAPAVTNETAAALPRSAAPDGARVFFVTPADGDTVTSPVAIELISMPCAILRRNGVRRAYSSSVWSWL